MARHPILHIIFLDSDALYLPTLFSDLFLKAGKINDWFLTPAPYFFPDYPMFFFAFLAGSGVFIQIILFSLIQVILTCLAIWLLAKEALKSNALFATTIISVALVWLALISGKPFIFLLCSSFHYGIFLTSILIVALYFWIKNHQEKYSHIISYSAIAILAFLATLSDNLFLVQLVAPFVVTVVFIGVLEKERFFKKERLLAIPIAFALLGSVAYLYLVTNNTRYPAQLGFGKILINLHDLYLIFYSAVTNNPIYGLIFFIYLGLVAYVLGQYMRKPVDRHIPKRLAWLTLFSFCSLACTSVSLVLATNLSVVNRYFIPALSWPVIVVFFFLNCYLARRFAIVAIVLSSLAVLSMSFVSYGLIQKNGLDVHYYPSQISCIDEALEQANVRHGIAQYWDAKYLQNFSRLDLTIAQYFGDLGPMHWITSEKYFRQRYDFAIISEQAEPVSKINSDALFRINGAPKQVVRCGDRSVYIYGKDQLRVQKITSPGDSYTWKACELPTVIGEKTDACQIRKKDVTQSGVLTYGPYEALPAGQYAFEIAYSSTAKKGGPVGSWDAVIALPKEAKMLKNGPLTGTDGKIEKIKGEFILGDDYSMDKIEIRTFAQPKLDLQVIYLQIKRVQ